MEAVKIDPSGELEWYCTPSKEPDYKEWVYSYIVIKHRKNKFSCRRINKFSCRRIDLREKKA